MPSTISTASGISSSKVERYVPLGVSSLSSDAPGWSNSNNNNVGPTSSSSSMGIDLPALVPVEGPICWKCKGKGTIVDKQLQKIKKNKKGQNKNTCTYQSSNCVLGTEVAGRTSTCGIHETDKTVESEQKKRRIFVLQNTAAAAATAVVAKETLSTDIDKVEQKHVEMAENEKESLVLVSQPSSSLPTPVTKAVDQVAIIDTSPPMKECKVCSGRGKLKPKQKEMQALNRHSTGMITKKRKCSSSSSSSSLKCDDWEPFGPAAFALQQMKEYMEKNDRGGRNNVDVDENDDENQCHYEHHPLKILHDANTVQIDEKTKKELNKEGVYIPTELSDRKDIMSLYPWLPINAGEQLCNLVGTWRILQRVGSHRYTTDDVCTAYIAKTEVFKIIATTTGRPIDSGIEMKNGNSIDTGKDNQRELVPTPLKYLDLGCGNGSVLQMVNWSLMEHFDLTAFGIEARSEAISMADRSLSFNIGKENIGQIVTLINGDFRAITEEAAGFDDESSSNESGIDNTSGSYCNGDRPSKAIRDRDVGKFRKVKKQKFDLVTGTPPYFRVDFNTEEKSHGESDAASTNNNKASASGRSLKRERVVKSAVINQGGMPTSLQSAPARCEFRGGIENYCAAAASVLAPDGIFVVCENWLNNDRVYKGAKDAGLTIMRVYPIKGTTRKLQNLFAVYVMKFDTALGNENDSITTTSSERSEKESSCQVFDPISVRGIDGKWTVEYSKIMASMSIP